jgi:hypothetical protein
MKNTQRIIHSDGMARLKKKDDFAMNIKQRSMVLLPNKRKLIFVYKIFDLTNCKHNPNSVLFITDRCDQYIVPNYSICSIYVLENHWRVENNFCRLPPSFLNVVPVRISDELPF